MLSNLEKIFDQIRDHTTHIGQIWYFIFIIFRILVLGSFGSGVYNDEASSFHCKLTGHRECEQQCFSTFSKMSYMRFWNLQLVAVAAPLLFFHAYVLLVTRRAKEIEADEKDLEKRLGSKNNESETEERKLILRRKLIFGKHQFKEIKSEKRKVLRCKRILIAYIVCLSAQIVIEIFFIIFGMNLFNIKYNALDFVEKNYSLKEYLWMEVPAFFKCGHGDKNLLKIYRYSVYKACRSTLDAHDGTDFVSCFISRPWEKTMLVRYMNILSILSLAILIIELCFLSYKFVAQHLESKRKRQENQIEYKETEAHSNVFSTSTTIIPVQESKL